MMKYDINHDKASRTRAKHKTTKMPHFYGFTCDIDKNISLLMKYIWLCKIDTFNSCENNVPDGLHFDRPFGLIIGNHKYLI